MSFAGFDPRFVLTGVTVTGRVLGHGSYATVLEVEYNGLKCAAKKFYEMLIEMDHENTFIQRFVGECRMLSQISHPNIVQFLGVYFQQGKQVPLLVMELLPINLTSCIGILTKEICYSILHDVALGLRYLHSQSPPIMHRDLCSNNILLTLNMTAKITGLGVAKLDDDRRIRRLSTDSLTPGTPAFMPPEAMVSHPRYDTSIDVFSFGILLIHMFSGLWPEPQVAPMRTESGGLTAVSEAERRNVFLQAIGDDHPAMKLILNCINNDPQWRPTANEVLWQLKSISQNFGK